MLTWTQVLVGRWLSLHVVKFRYMWQGLDGATVRSHGNRNVRLAMEKDKNEGNT